MKDGSTNWQSIGLGIVALGVIGVVLVFLFGELRQAPWQFLTILIALFGGLITFAGNLNIQIRNEQKEKKVEVYERVIQFLFEIIFSQKAEQVKKPENEVADFFIEVTPKLVLWASDDVLNCFINFRQTAFKIEEGNSNSKELILIFGKLLLAIRKDFGHQNNRLKELSILGVFVTDIENLSE